MAHDAIILPLRLRSGSQDDVAGERKKEKKEIYDALVAMHSGKVIVTLCRLSSLVFKRMKCLEFNNISRETVQRWMLFMDNANSRKIDDHIIVMLKDIVTS